MPKRTLLAAAALMGAALCARVERAAAAEGPAPLVTFHWVAVGGAGNPCDPTGPGRCFGAVGYPYRIAVHEVTNAQYAAFLNAKAASDPLVHPYLAT